MFNWLISRKTTDACVPVQHTKQEVCNPWFNSNWKTTLWLCHHHIFAFQFLPTNYPLLLWYPYCRNSQISISRSSAHTLSWVTESPAPLVEYRLIYRKISVMNALLNLIILSFKTAIEFLNSFSRCQDNDGDVLYVWTTLNLRAEHGFGNLYNQTYVLGEYHDRWKGHV